MSVKKEHKEYKKQIKQKNQEDKTKEVKHTKPSKSLKQKQSLKEEIKKILKDFSQDKKIKHSYDILGDIAIIELDQEFEDKKELIGKKIMEINPHVKTVLMKKGGHKGIFRIQEYEFICGEKKQETVHKENNVILKVNPYKSYFSVRLSNERKRIIELVKENEEILVMFSGVAPYAIELAKNTKANFVYGVELNPDAHKYAYENKFLNKAVNFLSINEDVKKFSYNPYFYILGLKSSILKDQLKKRIENPILKNYAIHEIHTTREDLYNENSQSLKQKYISQDSPQDNFQDNSQHNQNNNKSQEYYKYHNLNRLIETIEKLKELNKNVFVHMPLETFNEIELESNSKNKNPERIKEKFSKYINELNLLGHLSKKHMFYVIVHLPSNKELGETTLKLMQKYKKYFFYENLIDHSFLTTSKDFISRKELIDNVCIDVSHLGIEYSFSHNEGNYINPTKLEKFIKQEIHEIKTNFNTYFHISNFFSDWPSFKDGVDFNSGLLNIKEILPYVTQGIVEVKSQDESNPDKMLNSFNELKKYNDENYKKSFDRIIMPLPKGAETFLEDALRLSKKGTMIHVYDFLEENEFDQATRNILAICDKENKKVNIFKIVKCGQQSPRVYRVCFDLEVKN